MRLKKIEILGFKSFADRQIVVVDEQITSVIGPNGCGKSNIVDAMRWCMGEQSAKHLRGSGMSDVIFAGCATRGAAGMAEVTLTFETAGDGTAEPVSSGARSMPQIGITRRLFADGTSEYLINKIPSRLRDITELLMGTGAGTKGYAIIEQGQVGKIVSSKPEERRHIIDEAAGITRFKGQKAAAERKIAATRQNLLRVHDVITELDGRLSTLRRQAQKAERYKRYRTELRDLELWSASHRFLELAGTGRVLEHRRAELAAGVEGLRTQLSAREAEIQSRRLDLGRLERVLAERQQRVYDLDNRVQLLEAENEYRKREREGLLQSGAQARAEADVAARGLSRLRAELDEVAGQREALGDAAGPQGSQAAVERLTAASQHVEGQLQGETDSLARARSELADRNAQLAAAAARLQSQREAAGDLETRLSTARAELQTHTVAQAEAASAVTVADAALSRAIEELDALRQRRTTLDRDRASLREQVSLAEVELDTQRAELHRCKSRLQSLEEIQSRYRGCQSGVQVVMENRAELEGPSLGAGGSPASVHGILADHISAPQHLEAALSAVLGDHLEGVVVDEPQSGARGVELLKRVQEGRTTFLPRSCRAPEPVAPKTGTHLGWSPSAPGTLGGIEVVDLSTAGSGSDPSSGTTPSDLTMDRAAEPSTEPSTDVGSSSAGAGAGTLGRLIDLIDASADLDPLLQVLLGDTVVVDGLRQALELWQSGSIVGPVVTLDGDRIEPSGVVVGGSPTALDSALLQQKREIRELQDILAELKDSFEATRARHLGLAARLADTEAARERNEVEVLEAEKTRLTQDQAVQAATERRDTAQAAQIDAQTRCAALDETLAARRDEIDALQAQLSDVRTRLAELTGSIDASEGQLQALQIERETLASDLTEARIEHAKWQQQADSLEATRGRLQAQYDSEHQREARLRQSAEQAHVRAEELVQLSEQADTERAALTDQSKQATAEVHDAREEFDGVRTTLDEIEASVRSTRQHLDTERERLTEVDLGLQETGLERQHLERDVLDRFDGRIEGFLVDFHHRPRVGDTERTRAKELKRIISRMGEVNLTAIDEFEEVSARYEYLTTQRSDLESAITQLQEAIDRINKTTRNLFRETFEAVNERFREVFPRLFNGGRAELKMTDPSDLLGTGVEIAAQPPGKQLRSLDLLSGGEKALTAVSLIFAIFLIKPSPFCILDEVDAPLDDANVGRFCGLVRELSQGTQFIIITHNKVTMESADRLYGVTMEQRGISKLVSVNIRRAVEMAYN